MHKKLIKYCKLGCAFLIIFIIPLFYTVCLYLTGDCVKWTWAWTCGWSMSGGCSLWCGAWGSALLPPTPATSSKTWNTLTGSWWGRPLLKTLHPVNKIIYQSSSLCRCVFGSDPKPADMLCVCVFQSPQKYTIIWIIVDIASVGMMAVLYIIYRWVKQMFVRFCTVGSLNNLKLQWMNV